MSDKRTQTTVNPHWLSNPWAESSKVRNRGYQWPHKMDLGLTKTLKKDYLRSEHADRSALDVS